MSEHTKEPWHVGDMNNNADFIYGVDGWAIANCYLNKGISAKNARRIVACVNACASVPTDLLEKYGVETFDYSIVECDLQRKELLAVLKEIAEETYDQWSNGAKAKEMALAAIEKAEANHD